MAWVEPSDRLIVPSLPVTPGPAVAGPFTGGQMAAHDPLQLDFMLVSGANQYSVKPFAFVSTVTPLIFLVFSAVLDEPVLGDETVLTEEPADPAALAATAAEPGSRLWERTSDGEDFLRIRLGIGDLPASTVSVRGGTDGAYGAPDTADAEPPMVRDVPVAAEESILDAALRAGMDLPFACKGGMCSTCRAKLVEGDARMEVNYSLEPWELKAGFILTCQARPVSDRVTVDYDHV